MNTNPETYFTDGCGRCQFGGTPRCKVNNWPEELKLLRKIVLECGLIEESKWGVPCYTNRNRNIVIVSAFKEYCALSFFKGALLADTSKILEKPGENTQTGRLIKFTGVNEIIRIENILKAYIFEAIEVEKAGIKMAVKEKSELIIPEEFKKKTDEIPALKTAFETLTPGRQRAYLFHFSSPKQSKTRESRIENSMQQILNGKGLND